MSGDRAHSRLRQQSGRLSRWSKRKALPQAPHLPQTPRKGLRGAAARLGLWALFLQILLPLGQGVPLPAAADGLPRHLVICSANGGLRTVPLPGSSSSQTNTSAQGACAVCLSYAAGGHLTLPPPAPEPLPRLFALARIDPIPSPILQPVLHGLPLARGPPQDIS